VKKKFRVLFAPDYRAGVPYQELLAQALARRGVEVSFLTDYRLGLPLFRGSWGMSPQIVHVHWPEKYFDSWGDCWDKLRVSRYLLDFWLTSLYRPIVLTAHNLLPHNRSDEPGVLRNVKFTACSARGVFVHSEAARERIRETFGVLDQRLHVIPYGDHAITMGCPLRREDARAKLGLAMNEKICLVFGTVSPYKGTDELVRFWIETRLSHRLLIVGPIVSDEFAMTLRQLARHYPVIDLRLTREWLSDADLRLWLSATDCSIFNYREIFTSGAAALARSYGIPILIPHRLTSVDLDEPHPHVFRFDALDTDFRTQLEYALATPCDYDLAAEWRRKTDWERVAEITASVYRDVLETVRRH
jgi:glycosyltransferase involved in cell wall biosynthesis